MTVREMIMALVLNSRLDDVIELECRVKDSDGSGHLTWMVPTSVSRITTEKRALVECVPEEDEED